MTTSSEKRGRFVRRDNDRILIFDMRRAVVRIAEYTRAGRDGFMSSTLTQDAVIRNLEIVGEAGNKLSDDAKEMMSGIEWRRIVGLRNVLIHAYRDVELATVWRVVEEDLPALTSTLEELGEG